ncbi:hypothetical protein [Mucilaginibacter sp.]|uniref:hypothetical protein n=1 Tax=Mucilaginibacter sp. TaxID=1882438 RepID=UPI003D12C3DE
MPAQKSNLHKVILIIIALLVVIMGVVLICIPPALFPDPANGFQVLRSMQMGSGFNVFASPDQSDISQNYTEFLTWWSPGQYLVPYFFKLISGINLGQATAVTITLANISGLAGFYFFFKRIGFSSLVAALSLIFIICQLAFYVPDVYYNGGEILLFAFEGWFLYGCIALKKPDWKLVLFVLISVWIGFFFKSSFLWIYIAGLICLWISLCANRAGIAEWIKKGIWIGIPAAVSLAAIYFLFMSKGQSPATTSKGFKLAAETFSFPLATPLLTSFSLDDIFHGLIYHFGKPTVDHQWAILILVLLAVLSLLLIVSIILSTPNNNYKIMVAVFYFGALLFFGFAFLKQLNISYEARHFRIIGLLIAPCIITLAIRLKPIYRTLFATACFTLLCFSLQYVIKGYVINKNVSAKGVTGISQPNIDQASLNAIMKLDRANKNAIFVFVNNDIGLEIGHNRIITLPPVGDDLKIDMDDYRYEGFAGPLYIILPESYNGPKEKMIMKSFPGYAGFNISMLSDNYVLYSAYMERKK